MACNEILPAAALSRSFVSEPSAIKAVSFFSLKVRFSPERNKYDCVIYAI